MTIPDGKNNQIQNNTRNKMRTITTTELFTIHELKELHPKGYENACNQWSSDSEYPWSSEMRDVLKEFESIFPVKVNNWQVQPYGYSYITFKLSGLDWNYSDEIEALSGIRLAKWLWNNYRWILYSAKTYWTSGYQKKRKSRILTAPTCLTGYCAGYNILQPIRNFIQRPTKETLEDVMESCLNAWVNAYQSDMEYLQSEESFIASCDANGYEFDEFGSMA